MPRCRSWRATPQDGHAGHDPGGSCRRCWVPCRDRVAKGATRCEHCTTALIRHPEERVRLALAKDPSTPKSILLGLEQDLAARVSAAAGRRLAELGFISEGKF